MKNKLYLSILLITLFFASCQNAGKNKTGSEYMPDMGHSVAYEANLNTYYDLNRWGGEADYYKYVQPRLPVAGTIARGVLAMGGNAGVVSPNGASLYYYANTEEGRAKAMAEVTSSPYPITDAGINRGKELYDIYCATCHGAKLDGQGYLVREDGGKYPAQPANFTIDEHINATNGRYIHAIVHGRNLMGSYADKLSEKERWEVIHYIRSVQAKAKNLEYSEKKNTFNSDALYVAQSINSIDEASNHSEAHSIESNQKEGHSMSAHDQKVEVKPADAKNTTAKQAKDAKKVEGKKVEPKKDEKH